MLLVAVMYVSLQILCKKTSRCDAAGSDIIRVEVPPIQARKALSAAAD